MAVKQKIMLDVGCGFNKNHGFVGMDKRDVPGVDIVHDAEITPWPGLEDESCAVIIMSHLIEHIKPWCQFDVINECWRVLEFNGKLLIATPHGSSFGYMQDPTHCTPWNEATPSYFIPGNVLYEVYRPKPWKLAISTEGYPVFFYDRFGNIEVTFSKITLEEAEKIRKENGYAS